MKIDNSQNHTLKEIFKDSKGNLWYTLKNPLEISAPRGMEALTADRHIGLMISKKEFNLAIEALDKAAKELDLTTCFSIWGDLKYRSKMICEANSVLDLANVYYLLSDEDPNEYSEAHADLKRKIWAEDSECRAFFLRMGLNLTKQLASTSEEDLLKFMEETKKITERIYRFIPSPTRR